MGQSTLVVDPASTEAFLHLLSEKTGVPADQLEVRTPTRCAHPPPTRLHRNLAHIFPPLQVRGGFPPKLLQLPADCSIAAAVSLGLQSGDTLTVTRLAAPPAAAPVATAALAASGPPPTVSNGHHHAVAAAGVAGLSEDEQLARAIALSLGEAVPDLPPPAAAAQPPPRAASPARVHPTGPNATSSASQQQQQGVGVGGGGGGAPTSVPLPDGTAVVRRIVDSDNSCA